MLPDSGNQFMEVPPPKFTLADSLGFICKFLWVANTVGVLVAYNSWVFKKRNKVKNKN